MKSLHKHRLKPLHKASLSQTLIRLLPAITASIAALSSIGAFLLNFHLVERVKNDLAEQTLALNRQSVELDRVKTEIAKDAQRTADLNALTNQAQLALMVRQTVTAEKNQGIKNRVDERTVRADEARLTPDFAKLTNDLRPSVDTTCDSSRESSSLASLNCTFKNSGSFKVNLKITQIAAWDTRTETQVPGKIKSVAGSLTNNILANGTGSNAFYLDLADDTQALTVIIRAIATTDKHAIALTKRLSLGILGEGELTDLSTQSYSWVLTIPRR